jgi:hypothetical protein
MREQSQFISALPVPGMNESEQKNPNERMIPADDAEIFYLVPQCGTSFQNYNMISFFAKPCQEKKYISIFPSNLIFLNRLF